MKISKLWLVIIPVLFCIGAYFATESHIKVIELQTKVDTFDAEIKGLTNMQKNQMEFSTLQATINQLTFCLQATQIENEELSSTLRNAYQEVNLLRMNIQQMGMFIGQLLEDNSVLKEKIQELETKEKST